MVSVVRDPFVPPARFELRFASARRSLFSSTILGSVVWGALLLALAVLLPSWHPAVIEQIRPTILIPGIQTLPPPIIDSGRAPGGPPPVDRGGRIRPTKLDPPLPPAEPDDAWEPVSDIPPSTVVGPSRTPVVLPVDLVIVEPPATYVDVLPIAIHPVKPEYPDIARSAGVEGLVRVEVVVERDGTVRSARVLDPGSLFDQAALAAARVWRFHPATVDGHPVTAKVGLTFRFTLH